MGKWQGVRGGTVGTRDLPPLRPSTLRYAAACLRHRGTEKPADGHRGHPSAGEPVREFEYGNPLVDS